MNVPKCIEIIHEKKIEWIHFCGRCFLRHILDQIHIQIIKEKFEGGFSILKIQSLQCFLESFGQRVAFDIGCYGIILRKCDIAFLCCSLISSLSSSASATLPILLCWRQMSKSFRNCLWHKIHLMRKKKDTKNITKSSEKLTNQPNFWDKNYENGGNFFVKWIVFLKQRSLTFAKWPQRILWMALINFYSALGYIEEEPGIEKDIRCTFYYPQEDQS